MLHFEIGGGCHVWLQARHCLIISYLDPSASHLLLRVVEFTFRVIAAVKVNYTPSPIKFSSHCTCSLPYRCNWKPSTVSFRSFDSRTVPLFLFTILQSVQSFVNMYVHPGASLGAENVCHFGRLDGVAFCPRDDQGGFWCRCA